MELLHHPFLLDTVKTPQLRIALNSIRQKLHVFLTRLATRPAAQLVLIGPPGTRKIMLSHQIILIEAAAPKSPPNRARQSAVNFISKLTRAAIQTLQLPAIPNQNRHSFSGENEISYPDSKAIELRMTMPMNEPCFAALDAPADSWNFVTADKGFAKI